MPDHFGEKLVQLRRSCGLTQAELAAQLGIASQAYISDLEGGMKAPSLTLVVRIADYFQCTADYLLRDAIPVEPVPVSPVGTVSAEGVIRLFGAKLRTLRAQRSLTQVALAHQLGRGSREYLVNLEAGRKLPSLQMAVDLADFFGVTTDYLVRDGIPILDIEPAPSDGGHDNR